MPRGIPSSLEGWITKLGNMTQYSHLSVEEIEDLAKHYMARMNGESPGELPKYRSLVDLDDLSAQDPRFKKKFTKIWKEIFADIEGPKVVREHLSKQTAMAFLLAERKMIEEWNANKVGEGANQINNLSMVVARYTEQLQQTPATRRPGKGKDEQLLDALSAVEKATDLKSRAEELEQEDKALLGDGPETD